MTSSMLKLSYNYCVGLPRALFQILIQPIASSVNLDRSQDPLVTKSTGKSGQITQSKKCLLCKTEKLTLIPRAHVEKLGLVVHT